jgi:hypothetical protein
VQALIRHVVVKLLSSIAPPYSHEFARRLVEILLQSRCAIFQHIPENSRWDFLFVFFVLVPVTIQMFNCVVCVLCSSKKAMESQHFPREGVMALLKFRDALTPGMIKADRLQEFNRLVQSSGKGSSAPGFRY